MKTLLSTLVLSAGLALGQNTGTWTTDYTEDSTPPAAAVFTFQADPGGGLTQYWANWDDMVADILASPTLTGTVSMTTLDVSGTLTAGALAMDGATSGTVTIAVPAEAGTNTATFPAATGEVSLLGQTIGVAELATGTDGELITWDASGNPATVAVGTSGQVLTSNGAGAAPTFQDAAGGGGGAPTIAGYRQNIFLWEEFLSAFPSSGPMGMFEFARTTTGGSSTIGNGGASAVDSPGVLAIQTSTGSTNTFGFSSTSPFLLGGGTFTFETRLQVDDLTDGTDNFTVRAGLLDNAVATPVDGCFFRYSESDASWVCVTRSNNVETATDSATDVVADTWYRLGVAVNADGTSVVFTIDGSTVATHTTNIPAASNRQTGVGAGIQKTLGTNTRFVNFDYVGLEIGLTSSR